MSLLDIFVTYLAVGSAFAMRGYFLNRRRLALTRVRIALTQFFLWLPIWLFSLIWEIIPSIQQSPTASDLDPKIEGLIEDLLPFFPEIQVRKQAREALERYVALQAALGKDVVRASGQFELFAISGNGNGMTGTPCLYRKNLSKLKDHKVRAAADLIRLIHQSAAKNAIDSQFGTFFDAFGDLESIANLKGLNGEAKTDHPIQVRMAA